MAYLGAADSESQGTKSTVSAGVAVAADDGHAGLGRPELRANDMHDAPSGITHIE